MIISPRRESRENSSMDQPSTGGSGGPALPPRVRCLCPEVGALHTTWLTNPLLAQQSVDSRKMNQLPFPLLPAPVPQQLPVHFHHRQFPSTLGSHYMPRDHHSLPQPHPHIQHQHGHKSIQRFFQQEASPSEHIVGPWGCWSPSPPPGVMPHSRGEVARDAPCPQSQHSREGDAQSSPEQVQLPGFPDLASLFPAVLPPFLLRSVIRLIRLPFLCCRVCTGKLRKQ